MTERVIRNVIGGQQNRKCSWCTNQIIRGQGYRSYACGKVENFFHPDCLKACIEANVEPHEKLPDAGKHGRGCPAVFSEYCHRCEAGRLRQIEENTRGKNSD